MKPNELRIGNIITSKSSNIAWQVTVDDIILINDNPEHYLPIPLTEEFKIQFGNDKLVLVDKLGFVIFKNGYAYQFVFEDYTYIHSIQNIYFALTGEELTLK